MLYSNGDFQTLNARIALSALSPTPVCGQNILPALVRGDTVIYAPSSQLQGKSLRRALKLSDASMAALAELSRRPRADVPTCLALLAEAQDRVTLFCRMDAIAPDAYLAITPNASARSVCRVLSYSFDNDCELSADARALVGATRAADQATYALLQSLMEHAFRPLHQDTVATLPTRFPIHDRHTLFRMTASLFDATLHTLGATVSPQTDFDIPVALSFEGTLYLHRAIWLLTCLVGGILRRFPSLDWQAVSLSFDKELFLPTLTLPIGSRAALPAEWEECRRLAALYGMLFEVHRTPRTVSVRFCVATPLAPDAAAYFRLCAPEPMPHSFSPYT